jgi:hypothetical protein
MRIIYALVLLGLCAAPSTSSAQIKNPENSLREGCPEHSRLEDEQKFADFIIRTYSHDDFDDCIQILRDNRVVFSRHAVGKLVIGNDINKDSGHEVYLPPKIPIGTDITGRGKPNVILGEWSGGAHCCFAFHVLELGDHPRDIAIVDAGDSDYAHFEDLNHDGVYEFVGWDFTFAYWHAGFLQSPAPRIVLRFNGTRYELAPDLMRQTPTSKGQLNLTETKVRDSEWEGGYPPPLLWETMLDLIYTGHADLAWSFVEAAWSPERSGRTKFLQDFCAKLATSPYFPKLRPTIPTAPCKLDPNGGDSPPSFKGD